MDMGNGELAYALHEVVVVGVPFNKYADKFFEMLEVNVCVANMNLPGPKNGANHTGGGIQTIVSSKEVIGITTIVK